MEAYQEIIGLSILMLCLLFNGVSNMKKKQYSCFLDGEKDPNSTLVFAFKEGVCLKSLMRSHVCERIVIRKYSTNYQFCL